MDIARTFGPEIILCDVGLPGGLSGYDVARAIRTDERLRHCRLIALTGYGRDEDLAESSRAGFDVHLTKPVDYERLAAVLAAPPLRLDAVTHLRTIATSQCPRSRHYRDTRRLSAIGYRPGRESHFAPLPRPAHFAQFSAGFDRDRRFWRARALTHFGPPTGRSSDRM